VFVGGERRRRRRGRREKGSPGCGTRIILWMEEGAGRSRAILASDCAGWVGEWIRRWTKRIIVAGRVSGDNAVKGKVGIVVWVMG